MLGIIHTFCLLIENSSWAAPFVYVHVRDALHAAAAATLCHARIRGRVLPSISWKVARRWQRCREVFCVLSAPYAPARLLCRFHLAAPLFN